MQLSCLQIHTFLLTIQLCYITMFISFNQLNFLNSYGITNNLGGFAIWECAKLGGWAGLPGASSSCDGSQGFCQIKMVSLGPEH
jgi:hypothetical protein